MQRGLAKVESRNTEPARMTPSLQVCVRNATRPRNKERGSTSCAVYSARGLGSLVDRVCSRRRGRRCAVTAALLTRETRDAVQGRVCRREGIVCVRCVPGDLLYGRFALTWQYDAPYVAIDCLAGFRGAASQPSARASALWHFRDFFCAISFVLLFSLACL